MTKKLTVKEPEKKKVPDKSKVIGGSDNDTFNMIILNQAVNCLWLPNAGDEDRQNLMQGAMIAMQGIAPQDEVEGMLGAQLVASHSAAMECYRRAMLHDQTFAGRQLALNQANKLSRSFTTLMEALNKKRGKGQQKVTVKHVHVNEGGQAIVGNVEQSGGRDEKKN